MAARPVAYYCDADILGLAKVLSNLREDVTYPGDAGGAVRKRQRPACPITSTDVDDDVWIPIVAARGWSIITRDTRISRRPDEKAAVEEHGAKLFALDGNEARTAWEQLEIVMTQWRRIEKASLEPGPFIYSVSRSRLRRLL